MSWIVVKDGRVTGHYRDTTAATRAARRTNGVLGWLWDAPVTITQKAANGPMDRIMSATCDVFGFSVGRLRGSPRHDAIKARAVFALVAHSDGHTQEDIGAYLSIERSAIGQTIKRYTESGKINSELAAVKAALVKA